MAEKSIDLRSDTVTLPTQEMREAMMRAPLGDDVWGDDPTVNALQERCAAMFGKKDACFVPSGTMANQLAIRSQTKHGDEIIVHNESHIVKYEAGAAAALSGCSFAFTYGQRGFYTANDVENLIRPEDVHFGTTALVSLENTHNRGGGSIWPLEQLCEVCDVAHSHGLRTHLDGARIWNAMVATNVKASIWAKPFDTIAACFSKGLGCPTGSIVIGSTDTIKSVRRFRKMFGGGMRQVGFLAGAAMYALDHHLDRLTEDHANAKLLATGLHAIEGITCSVQDTQTNLVFFDLERTHGEGSVFCRKLSEHGVLAEALDTQRIRFVTHLGVTTQEVDKAIQITAELCKNVPTI